MTYKLNTAGHAYKKEQIAPLEALGFKFIPCDWTWGNYDAMLENEQDVTITLNTLDDLHALIEKVGSLVVSQDEITIYDNYLE